MGGEGGGKEISVFLLFISRRSIQIRGIVVMKCHSFIISGEMLYFNEGYCDADIGVTSIYFSWIHIVTRHLYSKTTRNSRFLRLFDTN